MSTEQYGNPGLSGISLKPAKTGSTTRLGVTAGNVVSQLRRMILEGQFSHEERLPAERNLAEASGTTCFTWLQTNARQTRVSILLCTHCQAPVKPTNYIGTINWYNIALFKSRNQAF